MKEQKKTSVIPSCRLLLLICRGYRHVPQMRYLMRENVAQHSAKLDQAVAFEICAKLVKTGLENYGKKCINIIEDVEDQFRLPIMCARTSKSNLGDRKWKGDPCCTLQHLERPEEQRGDGASKYI